MEQEKQLLEKNVIETENAQNIFQTWVQVKKRKHKKRTPIHSGTNDDKCVNTSISNVQDLTNVPNLINQEDYQLSSMSKKKKKQQRNLDEDMARSLSQLSTSSSTHAEGTHSFKLYGVQSESKVIKKEKCRRKSHSGHKGRKDRNNDKMYRIETRHGTQKEYNPTNFSSSDESEDVQTDPIVLQIKNVMNQHPSKKFKVVAKELTPFQKKQLRKSGLRIEVKSQKREKKVYKDRTQVERIIKKMKHSMDISKP